MEAEDIIKKSLQGSITALVPLAEVVEHHFEKPNDIPPEQVDLKDDEEKEESEEEEEDEETYYEYEAYESEEDNKSTSEEEEVKDRSPEQDRADRKELAEEMLEGDDPVKEEGKHVPLIDEDVPADKTAAEAAIMEGDSKKEIQLKEKLSGLQSLLGELKAERARVPKKQKSILSAIDEEIAAREEQLSKTKKKLKKESTK